MPPITFTLIRGLTRFVTFIFFGEVGITGLENLSKTEPIILVGNHKNQFVDALLVVALVHRPVSFLIAEKSMHRPIIGHFARAMQGIPVVRPADQARVLGPNARLVDFQLESNTLVGNEACQFTTQVKPSESIVIKGLGVAPLQIVEVINDTTLVVKRPVKHEDEPDAGTPTSFEIPTPIAFKVLPKVDQGAMFAKTFDALKQGKCVCLFPEGGSSDRTDLLPLKAGVSIMALGAASQGTPVSVVPFGINYNQPSEFRSRVLVDVGTPIKIPAHILHDFESGKKREAYAEFLTLVETGLRNVTLNAPDKQTLRILRCMRRMYQGDIPLEPKRFMELNRKFVLAFHKFRGNEEFLALVDGIDAYLQRIAQLNITDAQVASFPRIGSFSASVASFFRLVLDVLLYLTMFTVALPAYIIFGPMFLRISSVVKKEVQKALAGSSVKVKAHDVVASQKIMGALIWFPITVVVWTLVCLGVGALLQYLLPPNTSSPAAVQVQQNLIWILPVAFFVLITPYSYLAIRAMDVAARCKRRIPSESLICRSIFRPNSTAGQIRLEREDLVLQIQEFFEFVVVPQMEEWRVDPIVHRQTIVDRRRPSATRKALAISQSIREKDFAASTSARVADGATATTPPSPTAKPVSPANKNNMEEKERRKSLIREAMKNVQDGVLDNAFEQLPSAEQDDGGASEPL